jgi:serine protease
LGSRSADAIDPQVCGTGNFAGGPVFLKRPPDSRDFLGLDMDRRSLLTVAVALGALMAPSAAAGAAGVSAAREFAPRQAIVKFRGEGPSRAVGLPRGVRVRTAVAALERNPRVAYAAPNFIASASGSPDGAPFELPNDPGKLSRTSEVPDGWTLKQWNFLPWEGEGSVLLPVSLGGIDAVGAWQHLAEAGRPGAEGVTVAVLDTGVAYRSFKRRFRRSPDFSSRQFLKGYDFVSNDRLPLDQNGHGTHVAGTIAEKTNNGVGLTGLAYRAKLMPVRVLDRNGEGRADEIARGIRFAVDHGADVINMSFNFGCGKRVPGISEELQRAYRKGVVTVASVGNLGSEACVSPPATAPHVIGVGGTTEGGCLGEYSPAGEGVDLLAPGGGNPAPGCPSVWNRPIYQVTLRGGNPRRFAEPGSYVGTSMAAAHVSGVAAMVLASGVLTPPPRGKGRVNRVEERLRLTSRSLGYPAIRQGAGLIDAGRATAPASGSG